jgi:hypothetical protein
MEKQCFIVMPPHDPEGYPKGHVNRVYQYIILPACRVAGFNPVRVGDPSIDDTPLGIIKTIIESDHVLCDLSANNTDALHVFAIRQAMGLPVTLMKDIKTTVKANIPEFDLMEYDESLRIDTVENEIQLLGEALKKVFTVKGEPISLVGQLNIGPAKAKEAPVIPAYTFTETVATPSPEEDNDEEKVEPLPIISPLPDYVGEPLTDRDIDKLKVGDFFFHLNYGKGEILTINHKTKDILAKVQFDSGSKLLVLVPLDVFRKIKT